MQISGITKFSLIEYPGEISCIVFTPGCNFRCGYCHNSEFVLPEKLKNTYKNILPEMAVLSFLEKRRGKLTGVSICGGEPTIHKTLPDFCRKLKDMGYRVKLDTNGQSPETISYLIENKLVDYVAMDIKHEIGKFHIAAGVDLDEAPYKETISILLSSKIDYEFRTTVIRGVHDEKVIANISQYISGAKHYYLQNYRPGNTLDPNFIGESFTQKELEKLKDISTGYIADVGIRN